MFGQPILRSLSVRTVAALLLFATVSSVGEAQTGTTEFREPAAKIAWQAEANGRQYTTTLPIARLVRTPAWDEKEEHPPLSARKAMAAARKVVDRLQPYGKEAEYLTPSLKLRDDSSGHWFWVVYFSPNDFRQFQSIFPVVVLMDGTVVEPERAFPKRGIE